MKPLNFKEAELIGMSLPLTDDAEANELLTSNPLALPIGMLFDQQVY